MDQHNKNKYNFIVVFFITVSVPVVLFLILGDTDNLNFKPLGAFVDRHFDVITTVIVIFWITVIIALILAGWRSRQRNILEALVPLQEIEEEKKDDGAITSIAKWISGVDKGAILYQTGELIYRASLLNPHVLRGIDHLHHRKNFKSLYDLMKFMNENIVKSGASAAEKARVYTKYKGYTGEEKVIDIAKERGDQVEVPVSGTEPGMDIVINGTPYNVKITQDPSYIKEHLAKHPDIPVITNVENKAYFQDNPNVVIEPDLSEELSKQQTQETIDVSGNIDGNNFIVPLFITVSRASNAYLQYKNGKIEAATAIKITALSGAESLGFIIGKKAGAALGAKATAASGGTGALLIPILAITGGCLGKYTGGKMAKWVQDKHIRKFKSCAKKELEDYGKLFLQSLPCIVDAAREYHISTIKDHEANIKKEGFMKNLLFPSLNVTTRKYCIKRLREDMALNINEIRTFHESACNYEPLDIGAILFLKGKAYMYGVGGSEDLYDKIDEIIESNKINKSKIGASM